MSMAVGGSGGPSSDINMTPLIDVEKLREATIERIDRFLRRG